MKNKNIKKVLLIGSGPITIGQAAEFDFSGSQACKSLREEGIEVVLVNSNPATIMTDPEMADAVYIEPIDAKTIEKIIEKEKPDSVIAGIGGQTGLNVASELAELGVFEKHGVKLLGTSLEAIKNTEDRELFKQTMNQINVNVPRSYAIYSLSEAEEVINELGFPLIIRPAYTLGGAGGGIAYTKEELLTIVERGLRRSRIHQVLIEESVLGWAEYEYEVMRDSNDTCIVICNMENIDPMGVHTGESIVVTPSQTLSDNMHQKLRSTAIKVIRKLGIEGGCNIQFAVSENEDRFVVVEVNPRVSRSSALASKATGYPIAKITAKIAIGMNLDEILNDVTKKTPASFEPTIDYIVTKIPRWPFDKFAGADKTLTTSMKSTGEVMAIGRTIEESLLKAIRSLDDSKYFGSKSWDENEIKTLLKIPTHERLFVIYHAMQIGWTIDEISYLSGIKLFFLQKIKNIIDMENTIKEHKDNLSYELILKAKQMGFMDEHIAKFADTTRESINDLRRKIGIKTTYKMVDTCAAEFEAVTPYYYSCYESECELIPSNNKKILILGSGPIRIGQGIEFDYCTVHAISAIREKGIETHIINNNPETVSTDYDISDKLFFEPLTLEDVMNIIEREKPYGVLVQFGGQTSVNLALPLQKELERRKDLNTKILGTTPSDMDIAEDREKFNKLMQDIEILQPDAGYATDKESAIKIANHIGYPVLVRPSYVLGGRAMEIVYNNIELEYYLEEAVQVSHERPILIDDFLEGAVEIDVDLVSDGKDVLIGAIMEHIEEAGVHSGDSACVIPSQSLSEDILEKVRIYAKRIALALNINGLLNIQMAAKDDKLFVLEANPRSSRTIPFVSKAVGIPLAKIAALTIIGYPNENPLKTMGVPLDKEPAVNFVSVKEVILPFDKLPGSDPLLGPEMKSTGESMGIDVNYGRAFFKAQLSADNLLPLSGKVFISVRKEDRELMINAARKMQKAGLILIGTSGTVHYFLKNGIEIEAIKKIRDGSPNVIDMMRRNEVELIINTSSGRQSRKDGAEIRRAAVNFKVPYITTIQAAIASAEAIDAMKSGEITVKSINDYHRENF